MDEQIAVFFLEKEFNSDGFLELGSCLNQSGVTIAVISTRKADLNDANNEIQVKSQASYSRVNPEQPDLYALVDENSTEKLLKSKSAQKLIREADNEGKTILAAGTAVAVLAEAGILRDKNVTAPSEISDILQRYGAKTTKGPVVEDKNVITVERMEDISQACKVVLKKMKEAA